jgi:hypothetical protein
MQARLENAARPDVAATPVASLVTVRRGLPGASRPAAESDMVAFMVPAVFR